MTKWMWLYCDRSRISPTTTGKDLSKLVFYFPKQVLQTAASDISHDYKDFNQIEIKVTRHSYMKCQFWADLTNLVVFSMFSQWHWRTPLQSGSQRLSRAQVKIMIMVIFLVWVSQVAGSSPQHLLCEAERANDRKASWGKLRHHWRLLLPSNRNCSSGGESIYFARKVPGVWEI